MKSKLQLPVDAVNPKMLCNANALHEVSELDSDGCIFRGAIGANLAVFGTLLSHLAAVIGGTHKI